MEFAPNFLPWFSTPIDIHCEQQRKRRVSEREKGCAKREKNMRYEKTQGKETNVRQREKRMDKGKVARDDPFNSKPMFNSNPC